MIAAHHCESRYSLLNPLIQIPISFRNTIRDTAEEILDHLCRYLSSLSSGHFRITFTEIKYDYLFYKLLLSHNMPILLDIVYLHTGVNKITTLARSRYELLHTFSLWMKPSVVSMSMDFLVVHVTGSVVSEQVNVRSFSLYL